MYPEDIPMQCNLNKSLLMALEWPGWWNIHWQYTAEAGCPVSVGDEKFPMDMYFKQTSRDQPDGRECPGLREEARIVLKRKGWCLCCLGPVWRGSDRTRTSVLSAAPEEPMFPLRTHFFSCLGFLSCAECMIISTSSGFQYRETYSISYMEF